MADEKMSDNLVEIEFSVPGMVCNGCAEKVSKALVAVPGVHDVKPKLWRKHVVVLYESTKIHENQLKAGNCSPPWILRAGR